MSPPGAHFETRLSDQVSPMVVHRHLISQKYRVTSGTLFSIWRPRESAGRAWVMVLMASESAANLAAT